MEQFRDDVDIIEAEQNLADRAADLAGRHALRGYDAVHCAAGLLVAQDNDAIAASGNRRLLAAWKAEGTAVADITA